MVKAFRAWPWAVAALGLLGAACGSEPAPPPAGTPGPPQVAWTIGAPAEAVGSEPANFVVLAGRWVVAEEAGQKMVMVDGRGWKPGSPPSALIDKAARLYPGERDAFATRVGLALAYPFAVAPMPDVSDAQVTVRFKLVAGESDQFASILFGLKPNADYFALRYNTKDHDMALWQVKDGARERLHHGGTEVVVPLGEWHELRLTIRGAAIEGHLDGKSVLSFTLPSPPTGRVGLWAKPDSVTAYRDFTVETGK